MQVPAQSTLYAVAFALVLLLLNSVSSGLKDLKTDAASGATSFILSTGSRMVDGDRVQITKVVWVYSAAIQSAIFICQVPMLSFFNPGLPAKALVMVLSQYAALHLRMLLATQSSSRMRSSIPLLNGYYNYAALLLLLIDTMPVILQVPCGLLIVSLLAIPWRRSWRMWRTRYRPVQSPGS